MKLLRNLNAMLNDERARALASYREMAQRANDPKPGDAGTLRQVMGTLVLSHDDVAGDLAAVAEVAELRGFLKPFEEREAAERAFREWDAGEQVKMAALLKKKEQLRGQVWATASSGLATSTPAADIPAMSAEVEKLNAQILGVEREEQDAVNAYRAELSRRMQARDNVVRGHFSADARIRELARHHPRMFPDEAFALQMAADVAEGQRAEALARSRREYSDGVAKSPPGGAIMAAPVTADAERPVVTA
jgi:hypothetical protein